VGKHYVNAVAHKEGCGGPIRGIWWLTKQLLPVTERVATLDGKVPRRPASEGKCSGIKIKHTTNNSGLHLLMKDGLAQYTTAPAMLKEIVSLEKAKQNISFSISRSALPRGMDLITRVSLFFIQGCTHLRGGGVLKTAITAWCHSSWLTSPPASSDQKKVPGPISSCWWRSGPRAAHGAGRSCTPGSCSTGSWS
jgi:hypothetical protein